MRRFGLIGKNISYSFSKNHFKQKFEKEGINDASYENFDLQSIDEFPGILKDHPNIKGLNVTIPYKEVILSFLDELDETAQAIGAVNTIKVTEKGKLKGYNTDYYGFEKSIKEYLKPEHKKALILGTGGASKAIAYALNQLGIEYLYVSRSGNEKMLSYENLDQDIMASHLIIINCTPLGTFPNVKECPKIPYQFLTSNHLLYDLIYNPSETQFLKNGRARQSITVNGSNMLMFQAEKAWKIWNE